MATLKRKPSKVILPPRSCIVCTDVEVQLVRPCRNCETDYCVVCLVGMFTAATTDRSRMPPSCCVMLQMHTVISHLTPEQATAYCSKFEEWITPVKTYCPSAICSAFISEAKVPGKVTPRIAPTLPAALTEVVSKVIKSPSARFFRGEIDITQQSGYTSVVKHPINLVQIQDHVAASRYLSTTDLTTDMQLIVFNSRETNGDTHPITKTAEELFTMYLQELSRATDRLITTSTGLTHSRLFACPKCHIAICSNCKQVEHGESSCDTTSKDHEIAMLETFGYKSCPCCGQGVKKMYGCSHMQCLCGAHWCYRCRRPIEDVSSAFILLPLLFMH